MANNYPGCDTSYLFRILGDFWDGFQEKEQLACLWGGLAQLFDEEYLDAYQWDFGKSLETCPVYTRYMWTNLVLSDWESNGVFHKHYWMNFTTTGGEPYFKLSDLITDTFHEAKNIRVLVEGNALTENEEYSYQGGILTMLASLDAGLDMVISWVDDDVELPYHEHLEFAETLVTSKSTWTSASGDAFDPNGRGAYQSSDPDFPIEMWINGKYEPDYNYTETSDTSFSLVVATPPSSGDNIRLLWTREQDTANPHVHYKYAYKVQGVRENLFRVPFAVTTGSLYVRVNGVLLDSDEADMRETNLLHTLAYLEKGDLLEVEYRKKEFRYRHAIDTNIVSAPLLQDGIDKPQLVSTQGINHEFRGDGYLYCDYSDAEGFGDVWAPNIWVDEQTIARNFGSAVDFDCPTSPSYLYGTRGLWNVYWNGPAINNVEVGAKIVLGSPVAPAACTVTNVTENEDGSHTVGLSVGVDLEVPSYLNVIVVAGQALVAYQAVADGVWVYDAIRDPEWWRRFPGFQRLWSDYSVDGEPWSGRFDDRGFLDDGGYWDDAGDADELKQKLFELIKTFSFLVIINSSLLKTEDDADNVVHYLENIKPAYTRPVMLVDHEIEESVTMEESFSLELFEEGSS